METTQKQDSRLYSEDEALAMAQEVLGSIPKWFWENKEVIAKNRAEQEEWTTTIVSEINEFLERFDHIRQ